MAEPRPASATAAATATRATVTGEPAAAMPATGEATAFVFIRDKFATRARALFYARLFFLALGIGMLIVPSWARTLGFRLPQAALWYLFILGYHVASFLWIGRRHARPLTFVTLCLDLVFLIGIIVQTGGLASPFMPTQLVFTVFFALLFPRPLSILPPLLMLPVVARIEQILGTQFASRDVLLLLWHSAMNCVVVCAVVYLDGREETSFRELMRSQQQRRRALVAAERMRIARDIHDGLGASLSGMVLQAEYLVSQAAPGSPLAGELAELRQAGIDSMEELRRAVAMMRPDFELVAALEDHAQTFQQRSRVAVRFSQSGVERRLDPEGQLCCFRVLQEALTNVGRHAAAQAVSVELGFGEHHLVLAVHDDGRGFDPQASCPGHYGLAGMRERALRLGGELRVESRPGGGTTVELRLPLAGLSPRGRG